jgi:hypothetical protein
LSAGGEHLVSEDRDLFFEGTLAVHHAVVPLGLAMLGHSGLSVLDHREVPIECVRVDVMLAFGVEKLLDGLLVALLDELFELRACRPEARAPHKVRHQRDVVWVRHGNYALKRRGRRYLMLDLNAHRIQGIDVLRLAMTAMTDSFVYDDGSVLDINRQPLTTVPFRMERLPDFVGKSLIVTVLTFPMSLTASLRGTFWLYPNWYSLVPAIRASTWLVMRDALAKLSFVFHDTVPPSPLT